MSKLSEQREKERVSSEKPGPRWIWMIVVVAILICAWVGYDLYSARYANVSTLDGFAKCLSSKGARMYGAWWCPHCAEEKEFFGFAFQYVTYTECGGEKAHTENDQCKQAGIKNFPTWQFADGSRNEGELPLAVLGQKTGCKLP